MYLVCVSLLRRMNAIFENDDYFLVVIHSIAVHFETFIGKVVQVTACIRHGIRQGILTKNGGIARIWRSIVAVYVRHGFRMECIL